MKYDFIKKPINIKEIPKDYPAELTFIENCEKQVDEICAFLSDDNLNLLLVNGPKRCGKSEFINFATSYAPDENLIRLSYTCFETSTLDDMFLSFFEAFKNYTLSGKISSPKIKVDNFNQKINSYFNSIKSPILLTIDNFDAILKENKTDIINFLQHLIKFPNIKTIIISRGLINDEFPQIQVQNLTIPPLSQKIFEKYLKENGIKQIGVFSNELYKQSKGYFGNVRHSINVMWLEEITLVNFIELYSKSFVSFDEFIIKELLKFVDPVSIHLFRLLTLMRIPIHTNLLKNLRLFDKNRIDFFVQNSILNIEGESLYIKEEFRAILETQIPESVLIKLHSACVDLYNTQLPLKPLERDLKLSRGTMRNEIYYHSLFLPKKIILTQKQPQTDEKAIPQEPLVQNNPREELTKPPVEVTKEQKFKDISFIIEDEAVLDNIANSIKDFVSTSVEEQNLMNNSETMDLKQLLNLAKQQEAQYNYKSAITLYQNALTKKDDDDFYTFLPAIYVNLAKSYLNLSDLYEALEYFTQAQDFYVNTSNTLKASEIKLEISKVYYKMYKHKNAEFILSELEKSQELPNELMIRINLTHADMIDNPQQQYEYYKKSLELVDPLTDKTVLSELYYKYGACCDEFDEMKTAAIYYKKCIDTDKDPKNNKYLALALSGLAELYDDAGQQKPAIKYYEESIKIDTSMKNYSGLYFSSTHLGEIYSSFNDILAVKYLQNAYSFAKILDETFYIVQSQLKLGDFYLLRKNTENAYKYFIQALNTAQSSFSQENLDKIQSRINDIKRLTTPSELENYQEKYGK